MYGLIFLFYFFVHNLQSYILITKISNMAIGYVNRHTVNYNIIVCKNTNPINVKRVGM